MQLISDFHKDIRTPKPQPGAYEWWYFDAIDQAGRYTFVVIFYEGNPFSPSYINALDTKPQALAKEYPAISISVYDSGTPIYYSFTEFNSADCFFDETKPAVSIGNHSLSGYQKDGKTVYELALDEVLPSGDSIRAELSFTSDKSAKDLFKRTNDGEEGHCWNLVQPYAKVEGYLRINKEEDEKAIDFKGTGYHDHNTGGEPMKEEFEDWYWGRFHFRDYTLIYYLMNQKQAKQHKAWLVDRRKGTIAETFNNISLKDTSLNMFGIKSARKVIIKNESTEITVQQSSVWDSGPFYQRFGSEAFLFDQNKGDVESVRGISEYIYPDRIYSRIFWPLVNMRIHNKKKGPHWVQKSKRLYRWTW